MSCGVERAETEVEVVPTIRRTAGVVDQNSAVYHDAADTDPQIDVSVLWTTAVHSWRTELINSNAKAFVTPITERAFLAMLKPFHIRPGELNLITLARLFSRHSHTISKLPAARLSSPA